MKPIGDNEENGLKCWETDMTFNWTPHLTDLRGETPNYRSGVVALEF